MGIFRRATTNKKPEQGKFIVDDDIVSPDGIVGTPGPTKGTDGSTMRKRRMGGLRRIEKSLLLRQNVVVEDETIGENLAPEDQFYLEIPVKRGSIAAKKGDFILSRKNKQKVGDVSHGTEEDSDVSSITDGSIEYRRGMGASQQYRQASEISEVGCCGPCNDTDELPSKNIRFQGDTPPSPPNFYHWLMSCGSPEEWRNSNQVFYRRKLSGDKLEPGERKAGRTKKALFDGLEGEDAGSLVEIDTVNTLYEGTPDTKASIWKRLKIRRKRSVPKLRRP